MRDLQHYSCSMEGASPFQELRDRAALTGVPLHAQIELTHRCNHACSFCYLRDQHENGNNFTNELSLPEIQSTLRQLAEMQTLFLTITGGEIFTRSDIFEILSSVRNFGFACLLLTNGSLIGEYEAVRLAELQIFQVHISLLGIGKTHDHLTGVEGSYDRAISAIRLLKRRGVTVIAKLIISNDAFGEMDELIRIAEDEAGLYQITTEILPTLKGAPPPEGTVVPVENFRKYFTRKKTHSPPLPPAPSPEAPLCAAGKSLLAIGSDGTVYPCITFRMPLGNIREKPLAEIWQTEILQGIRRLTRSDLSGCAGCPNARFCGFCPGRAWHESGDLTKPAPTLCDRAAGMRLRWEAMG